MNPVSPISTVITENENKLDTIRLCQESEKQKSTAAKQKSTAALKIQSVYRVHISRKQLKNLKNQSALKIQKIWRGDFSRSIMHLLKYEHLDKAKFYIDTPAKLQDLPRASSGKTPVYLPKELPIVLKQSGYPQNRERFIKMKQGHTICKRSGYKHLIIPQARLYKNFIVESRLPIMMHGTKEQMGLYVEHRDLFTEPVKEFTGFLCQSLFSDLTSEGRNPYGIFSKSPVGRYDNISLYLEKECGKIGLVDLEEFAPERYKQNIWVFGRCVDAVHLFPYHFNEILNVAESFDPSIKINRKDLEIERDEGLKRFKLAYENHKEFIKEKGISLDNPLEFKKIEFARKMQFKDVIVKELDKANKDHILNLGDEFDKTVTHFNEKALLLILDAALMIINNLLEVNLKEAGGKESITSSPKLLSVRTLIYSSYYGGEYYDLFTECTKDILPFLEMLKVGKFHKNFLISSIFDAVFKEFENGKEIAYFTPEFGYGTPPARCIFC